MGACSSQPKALQVRTDFNVDGTRVDDPSTVAPEHAWSASPRPVKCKAAEPTLRMQSAVVARAAKPRSTPEPQPKKALPTPKRRRKGSKRSRRVLPAASLAPLAVVPGVVGAPSLNPLLLPPILDSAIATPASPASQDDGRRRSSAIERALVGMFEAADKDGRKYLTMKEFVALSKATLEEVDNKQFWSKFREIDTDQNKTLSLEEWLRVCGGKVKAYNKSGRGSVFTRSLDQAVGLHVQGALQDKLSVIYDNIAGDSTTPDAHKGKPHDTVWLACEIGSLAAVRRLVDCTPPAQRTALINAPHPTTGKHSLLYSGPNNHHTLSTWLLDHGALITPTTQLNSQNPRLRALYADKKYQRQVIRSEVPASGMTQQHLQAVAAAAAAASADPRY